MCGSRSGGQEKLFFFVNGDAICLRSASANENGLASKTPIHCGDGGAERDRTADLVIANSPRPESLRFLVSP